jgi:NAD(P)-dependent dehydrogenase (short-subunit alcohol dehydrogenase family)
MPTYVLTGANRGLGLEFVRQLSQSSENTIVACVRSSSTDLGDLRSVKNKSKATVHIAECDTSFLPSIHAFAKSLPQLLGDSPKIDVLLNNAGINATPEQTSLDITQESLREHIDVNVMGPAETVKVLDGYLGRGGTVLNMTSGLGSCGKKLNVSRFPFLCSVLELRFYGDSPRFADCNSFRPKCTTYAISKAAVNMLTVHQAEQLKDRGIKVICMDPGWVKTRMGGEGAILEPDVSIAGVSSQSPQNMYSVLGVVTDRPSSTDAQGHPQFEGRRLREILHVYW